MALMSTANEIGYGGAAGGGKSHLGRVSAIHFCANIPGLQVYLFRRQHNELNKNHFQGPTSFPAMLHPWVKAGFVRIVKDEIRFWNGSKIFACHCQHEKDVFNWLGPEMHYLIIEQAEQFTPFMITMLRGRNRIPEALNIPEEYKALFPRCLYTFNPGGVGHAFFKSKFVKALKRGANGVSEIVEQPDDEGGKLRQFIQAKLDDNPSVNPTEYRKTLRGLPPRMAKALEEGDFDQVVGAFFPEIDRRKHFVKPFKINSWDTRLMSMDWGSCGEADPFSISWAAVMSERMTVKNCFDETIVIPRNALVVYRRWYGKGLPKVTASQVAKGILEREKNDQPIVQRVAGGDIDDKRGHGPSIFEIFSAAGINFTKADRRRQPGHLQFRERLVGKNNEPMIYWFDTYDEDIETIMNLQHDLHDPNECTENDDHCLHGDTLIKTDKGNQRIRDLVGTTGRVYNHNGELVPFWNCKSYGVDKMVELSFSDGSKLICTPDHKIFDIEKNWTKAIDMLDKKRYVVKTWKSLLFQILVRSLTALNTTYAVSILVAKVKSLRVVVGYIGLCGYSITVKSLKALISTTKTTIELIINYPILALLERPNTLACTCPQMSASSTAESILIESGILPQHGTAARQVEKCQEKTSIKLKTSSLSSDNSSANSVTKNIHPSKYDQPFVQTTANQHGEDVKDWTMFQQIVLFAIKLLQDISTIKQKLAAKLAQGLRALTQDVVCLSVRELQEAESFCLDTPDPHSFLTASGIVVHNCYEDTRYLCMSRPWVKDKPAAETPIQQQFRSLSLDEMWSLRESLRER